MVTTVTTYTDSRNRAAIGEGYDGVVRVSIAGYYGTGVLLYDGRAILTAAHLLSGSSDIRVSFETSAGSETQSAGQVLLHPNYDSVNDNNDLAIVWLNGAAPKSAERYSLYRDSDEIGQMVNLVGYGVPGTGSAGQLDNYSGSPLRLKAGNQFDADVGTLKNSLGLVIGWTPTAGTQLIADFDDGTTSHDALGRLINLPGMGLGLNEGLISPGDSGGPAFINGQVAGIASYTASLSYGGIDPDIDAVRNSSFGEVAAWQRLSHYQQWIDQSLRANYANAPKTPAEVKKDVAEGNAETSTVYFLLQFTGLRSDPNQTLSVDYITRDGTAKAAQDYLGVSGTLKLYPNETQAVIPVEIVGDTTPEADETFYLDVTNPVGGSFGEGVIRLTAIRTIVDDDAGVG